MRSAGHKDGRLSGIGYAAVIIGLLLAIGYMASAVRGLSGQSGEAPVASEPRKVAVARG